MKRILSDDLLTKSQFKINNSFIKELLESYAPELNTSEGLNLEILSDILGIEEIESEGRFGLNWNGKIKARRVALTPSTGTLRPTYHEGLSPIVSDNLIIQSDNIEALKLLQKSYANKIKCIYIDPPYNVEGSSYYPDDFAINDEEYKILTGQKSNDGFVKTTNLETGGGLHTKWLNKLYPRLKLAWSLLTQDGSIWISIDDVEYANLKLICDEIFGGSNFVATFVWEKRTTRENRRVFSFNHDYVLCYSKNKEQFEASRNLLPATEKLLSRYKNPDNDPRGDWQSVSLNAMAGHATESQFYTITKPNGEQINPPPGRCWVVTEGVMNSMRSDNRIWFGKDGAGVPRQKMFLSEAKEIGLTPHTLWAANEVGTNDSAKKQLNKLFDDQSIFDTPKPVGLIQRIIQIACSNGDLVMDFYSGSGTTGHSVLKENYENNRNLRYIMVQFPEWLDNEKKEHKAATDFLDSIGKPRNIAEITKERMRRVAAKIIQENPDYEGDLGFKVFNWDSSNIKQWDGESENLQKSLEDYVNQVKDDRSSMDILYEVILKSGIHLTADIDEVEVGDNNVLSVDNCRLLACLDKEIKSEAVADIALTMRELKNANPDAECMVLFLDSGFVDSSGKLNMSETLKQNGFVNIRSI